jgi:hypothetical protein
MLLLKLSALLKSVKKWVFNLLSAKDWADKEAEHFFRKDKDESN